MTFEDKICFLLCTSLQGERGNFRYNLSAFSLLFYYITCFLLTKMINTVFSESFFPFPVLIFHFRQPKTISTQRGRVYVGVGFRGKLLPKTE